jgi:predicted permease
MAPGESLVSPSQTVVSDGYFEAMKIDLVRGRYFDARDHEKAQRVIIVDERLAKKIWQGQDPIGKYMFQPSDITNLMTPPPRDQWFTVIGVVEEIRLAGLVDSAEVKRVGAYYYPLPQSISRSGSLAVRTIQEPATVTAAIRREIAAIDPELPFYGVRTMQERLERSLVDRRTPMILAVGFAVVALFLAAIGIYGVIAYSVAQRTQEIGVRMALGARPLHVLRLVFGQSMSMLLIGIGIGLVGAFALTRWMRTLLFEITATDPLTYVSVIGLLAVVALLACYIPARRAAKVDPLIALRYE